MRRRRPQLQVSLFPFLSVLLCTLGALILLLLVLDQKARASREREAAAALEAARDLRIRQLAEARARMEAEVRERSQPLRAERTDLERELDSKGRTHAATQADLERRMQEAVALERLLAAEETRVRAGADARFTRAAESQRLSLERTQADDARARLLEQLRAMERLIAQLRDADRQRKPVYSLVPYKGKHGTGRQPVYIECIGEQIIFRPDGGRLTLAESQTPGTLPAELERRFAALPKQGDQNKPYALLLIRPSGLSLYYAVLAALRKAQIDVGYEFVDEDWVLDFSGMNDSAIAKSDGTGGSTGGAGAGGSRPSAPPGVPVGGLGATGGPAGRPEVAVRPEAGSRPTLTPPAPTRPVDAGRGSSEQASQDAKRPGRRAPSPVRPDEGRAAGAPTPDTSVETPNPADATAASRTSTPPKPVGGGSGDEAETEASRPRLARPTPLGASANEWTILIECTATGVNFKNAERSFSPPELAGPENALLVLIRRQVEQKRARNPDLRPRVKYLIHEDALRNYYAAAGALESLRLPATWELVKEQPRNHVATPGEP